MFLILIVLVVILIIVVLVVAAVTSSKKEETKTAFPFKLKKYFFNRSEQEFFRILEEQIDHTKYSVFPKVRLGDLAETTNGGSERWGSWNRIKSRHVDFLIYDTQKSTIAVAIELDGSSHRSAKAQEKDAFKDQLFTTVNLPLVRVKVGTNFAQEIAQIISKL